jgi:hypothetical protein
MRVTMATHPRKILGSLIMPRSGCSGAGAGPSTRWARGRRPGSGAGRGTGTATWASVWPEFKEMVEIKDGVILRIAEPGVKAVGTAKAEPPS